MIKIDKHKFFLILILISLTLVTIVSVFIYKTRFANRVKIYSVYPKENTQNVHLNSELKVQFTFVPLKFDLGSLTVKTEPSIEFSSNYNQTKNELIFIPKQNYSPDTNYSVNLITTNGTILYNWKFKTTHLTEEDIQQDIQTQAQEDIDFNTNIKQYYEKYPFAKNLPIKTEKYIIVFDSSSEKIFVLVKASYPSVDDARKDLEEEVIFQLLQEGVDTNTFDIEWSLSQ